MVAILLFVGVLLTVLAYPALNAVSMRNTANAIFSTILAVAFIWQLFTVYHHGQRVLQWLLLSLYLGILGMMIYGALA